MARRHDSGSGDVDRLRAILAGVQGEPGWLPDEDVVVDGRPRRTQRRRAAEEAPAETDRHGDEQRGAGRHADGSHGRVRPHEPLPRTRLPDTCVQPTLLAVAGALLVLLVGALVFAGRAWWADRGAQPQPVAPASAPRGPTT